MANLIDSLTPSASTLQGAVTNQNTTASSKTKGKEKEESPSTSKKSENKVDEKTFFALLLQTIVAPQKQNVSPQLATKAGTASVSSNVSRPQEKSAKGQNQKSVETTSRPMPSSRQPPPPPRHSRRASPPTRPRPFRKQQPIRHRRRASPLRPSSLRRVSPHHRLSRSLSTLRAGRSKSSPSPPRGQTPPPPLPVRHPPKLRSLTKSLTLFRTRNRPGRRSSASTSTLRSWESSTSSSVSPRTRGWKSRCTLRTPKSRALCS